MADGGKTYVFKDPTRLTRITIWSIYALAVFESASLLSGLYDTTLLQIGPITDGANALRQGIVTILDAIATIVAGVLTLMWIYRASANAHSMKTDAMDISPGWAVGWYFIPVASLWKPFQAMREIWNVSQSPTSGTFDTPAILRWWWGLWIIDNIAAQASFRLTGIEGADTLASTILSVIGNAADIGACVLLVTLMHRIAGWQTGAGRAEAVFA